MGAGIRVKTILNKKKQRDVWFLDDYTINPYSGCSFNCLYCYIRGSKYGEHMEKKTSVKLNAAELLDKQLSLRAKKNEYGIIVLSSSTDPYLQLEKGTGTTREILKLILKHKFPLHVITKSDLVLRDLDLISSIAENAILPDDLQGKLRHKAFITFSFSGIDEEAARVFEPGATPPSRRLDAIRNIADAGLHTGVSMMPLIPFITDTAEHLEEMFASFKTKKAAYVMPSTITLFGSGNADSKTLMLRAIAKHYPHLLERYQKWFATSNELPANYRMAFGRKMKELSLKYNLPDRILTL
jgi:DNA repair photolyase